MINVAKVSAMICEYFAVAINAVHQVKREPYYVSTNRIEVNKFDYYYIKVTHYGLLVFWIVFLLKYECWLLQKWRLYSEFKCRYYGAVTALFQGQHVQDQLQQMGTRVSYYRRAVNLLGRASLISENDGKSETVTDNDDNSADDDYYYYLSSEDRHSGSGQSVALKVRFLYLKCTIIKIDSY